MPIQITMGLAIASPCLHFHLSFLIRINQYLEPREESRALGVSSRRCGYLVTSTVEVGNNFTQRYLEVPA